MKLVLKSVSLSVFLFLLFFISGNSVNAQSTTYKALLATLYDSDFPVLKPSEVKDLSKYQVVDTREKKEFDVSHLQGAQWVGYDTFSLKNVANLDKDQPVLVYCTVGARSQEIGKSLKKAGFKEVYNLYGGLIEWANEEKPIFNGDSLTSKVHTYSQAWGIWLINGEKVY